MPKDRKIELDVVLGQIRDYISENGRPPTYREIASRLGVAPGTAHRYVKYLARRGSVVVDEGSRGIKVL